MDIFEHAFSYQSLYKQNEGLTLFYRNEIQFQKTLIPWFWTLRLSSNITFIFDFFDKKNDILYTVHM